MNQLIWERSNFEDTAVICKHYVFNLEISKNSELKILRNDWREKENKKVKNKEQSKEKE